MTKHLVCLIALLLSAVVATARQPQFPLHQEGAAAALPEGIQPEDYTLKIVHSIAQGNTYQDVTKEFTTKVAFSGSDVYVAGLAYYFPEAFVHGTLTGTTVTFPSGQFLGEDMYGEEYLSSYTLNGDDVVISDFTLFYDAKSRTLTFDGSTFIGETSEPNAGGLYAYVKAAVFTPGALPPLVKVDVPEGLQADPFMLMANYIYSETDDKGVAHTVTEQYVLPVAVAFHGDDLYIQGLVENVPEDWVKATKNAAGNYVIPAGQYVGTSNVYNQQFYDYYVMAFNRLNNLQDITFTYNEASNTITSAQTIAVNASKSMLQPYYYLKDINIKKIVEKEATPAAPTFTFIEEPSPYGSTVWYYADLHLPLIDTDNDPMLTDKLSFMFYSKKGGEAVPITFPAGKYYMLDEDITEIPYSFTDRLDISNHTVYFEKLGIEELQSWSAIGLQTIYRGLGKEHRSDIVWFDLSPFWDSNAIDAPTLSSSESLTHADYDLQGRHVTPTHSGLVLRRSVNADGTVTVRKYMNRP